MAFTRVKTMLTGAVVSPDMPRSAITASLSDDRPADIKAWRCRTNAQTNQLTPFGPKGLMTHGSETYEAVGMASLITKPRAARSRRHTLSRKAVKRER